MCICKTLGLDVTWLLKIFFDETFAATESRNGLAGCRFKKLCNFFLLVSNLDASATATERCLDGNWQSVFCNKLKNFFCTRNRIDGSGSKRCANLFGNVAC